MTRPREFTGAERRAIFEKCDGRCVDCGSDEGPFDYDHALAAVFGGQSTVENGVLRCRGDCHTEKTRREVAAIAKADRIKKRRAGRKVGNHQYRNRKARQRPVMRELPF